MEDSDYFQPYTAWQCEQLLHQSRVPGAPFGYQGGLNLYAYCKAAGWDNVQLLGDTVNDWWCTRPGEDPTFHVSMAGACQWTYSRRTPDDYAIPIFNYWIPASVRCWR